jgi:serine/threonine protein kinase
MCPVCQTPAHRGADECPNCGLVFQSRVPSALRNLPDYEVLRPLSSGGMSSVYLARRRSGGELCVLKTLASVESQHDPHWHAEASRCLRQEYNLLMQIDHPNIARKLSWFGSDLLVLEYVPGPTLEQLLEGAEGQNGNGRTNGAAMLARGDVLAYGVCVAEVLDYLANLPQPVVHHDIKPANLIIRPDDGRLVLVDFGSAVLMPEEGEDAVRLDTYGTPGYAAPEQYQGQSSPASDVYGLAATLYHLLTGDDPTAHPLAFPKLRELPDALADVLAAALAHEPQARPTAQQFCDALQAAMLTLNIEKARGA